MRIMTLALAALIAFPVAAQDAGARVQAVLSDHVLPGFDRLAQATEVLKAAASDCTPDGAAVPDAFGDAFDAWISVSHLRFGPTEVDDRAFGMAFWPDSKGFTKKALNRLISAQDQVVEDPDGFSKTSIAGRGLFALEYLLFDDSMRQAGTANYRCALTRAITVDLDANADAILADWRGGYGDQMLRPGMDGQYGSSTDALQVLYQSLVTGVQFNVDNRLGRPLGTFERPRPRRAEAWRSGRSARNVAVSLRALSDLSGLLAQGHDTIATKLGADFARLSDMVSALDDPAFAGVTDPVARFRIEAIQTALSAVHLTVAGELGAALGVAEGFNALDGD